MTHCRLVRLAFRSRWISGSAPFTIAVAGGCDDGDRDLARAYGARTAALVRRNAPSLVYEPGEPSLPVDWRRCRAHRCADAPDDRDLDVHRSRAGQPATVFTHV